MATLKKGTLVRLAALILMAPFAVWMVFFTDFDSVSGGKPPAPAVSDRARVLGPEQVKSIAESRASLMEDFAIDLVIITVPGRVDMARQAAYEFDMARVGSFGDQGRGLLLLIAPDSNAVRLEVSQALEGIYTNAFVSHIEQRQLAPFFQSNRVGEGIRATTGLIYDRAAQAKLGEEFEPGQ